jgi:hypothetical protein
MFLIAAFDFAFIIFNHHYCNYFFLKYRNYIVAFKLLFAIYKIVINNVVEKILYKKVKYS